MVHPPIGYVDDVHEIDTHILLCTCCCCTAVEQSGWVGGWLCRGVIGFVDELVVGWAGGWGGLFGSWVRYIRLSVLVCNTFFVFGSMRFLSAYLGPMGGQRG